MADKYVLVDQSELKRVVDTYKAAMGLYDATLTWQQVAQCFDEQVACIRDVTSYGSTYEGCVVGINISTDRNIASASFPSAISVLLGKATNLSGITASGSPNIESFSAPEATTIGSSTLNGIMPQSGAGGWRNTKGMILDLPKVTSIPDEAFKKSTGVFKYMLDLPEVVSIGQHAFSKEALGISDSWSVALLGLSAPKCRTIGNGAIANNITLTYGIGTSRTQDIDYNKDFEFFDREARLVLTSLLAWSIAAIDDYGAFTTYHFALGALSEIDLHSVTSLATPGSNSGCFHTVLNPTKVPCGTDQSGATVYGNPLRKLDLHSLTTLAYGYRTGQIWWGMNTYSLGNGFFRSVVEFDARTPSNYSTFRRLEYLDLHSATYIPDGDLADMPAMKYLDVSSMTSLDGKGFTGSVPLETFLAGSLTAFPTWLSGCANLKEADLSGLSAIPDGAFAACPAMETLRINNPVAFPDEDSVRNAAGFPWGLPAGATVYFNTRESGDSLTVEED